MNRKTVLILLGVFILGVLMIANRSHKVNWSTTFNETKTNPFDTKIFFDQLPIWFPKKPKQLYTTFYEYDNELIDSSDSNFGYMSISNHYPIDKVSFESLLKNIKKGGNAFISANVIPSYVQDSLGIIIDYEEATILEAKQTLFLEHYNDSLTYIPKIAGGLRYIRDTLHIKSLGFFNNKVCEQRINFAGIPYYKGVFYIHTNPEIFTNYQILASEHPNYLNTVVSYLKKDTQFLYDKIQKINPELQKGSLSFIKSKPPLKWAWYVLLLGIILFLIFNAKRRQRAIPIITPLKNTTTQFVHTISTLHYEAEDYNGMIQKKIIYFLETIRNKYHLKTDKLDADFVKKLAQKTNRPAEDIERLIGMIIKMKSHTFSSKEPLIRLDKEIESFYS